MIVSEPNEGTVTVNSFGVITYVHNGSTTTTTTDTFSYTVSDFEDAVSNIANVSIAISETPIINLAPIANNDTVGPVQAGGTINFLVTGNDVDNENKLNLANVVINSSPIDGIATVNPSGTITYINTGTEAITDTLTYTVADAESLVFKPSHCFNYSNSIHGYKCQPSGRR